MSLTHHKRRLFTVIGLSVALMLLSGIFHMRIFAQEQEISTLNRHLIYEYTTLSQRALHKKQWNESSFYADKSQQASRNTHMLPSHPDTLLAIHHPDYRLLINAYNDTLAMLAHPSASRQPSAVAHAVASFDAWLLAVYAKDTPSMVIRRKQGYHLAVIRLKTSCNMHASL